MKKLFWLLLFILALVIAGIYFLIPTTLTISSAVSIEASAPRITELLATNKALSKWWPEKKSDSAAAAIYKGQTFDVSGSSYNLVEIAAGFTDSALSTKLQMVQLKPDSSIVEWTCQTTAGFNPIKRVQQYRAAVALKENMTDLLLALKTYADKKENIYGMKIEKLTVKDTVLVSTRAQFDHLPTTDDIYGLVNKLQAYIASENATATNYPMLNLMEVDKKQYNVMVGIPTNKLLKGKGDIELKRMVMGNILVGQFSGGMTKTLDAFYQMDRFKADFQFTTVAIPFAQLITDRSKESDSTKWISSICLPVL